MLASIANKFHEMVLGESAPPVPAGPYEPTPLDICKVRALMVARIGLPEEIVDSIFDFAEYWAHSSNYIDYMEEHKDPLRIAGGCRLENRFLVSFTVLTRMIPLTMEAAISSRGAHFLERRLRSHGDLGLRYQ